MYFGVDYHPEQWVYPYAGTPENPEEQWDKDAELMRVAGLNVVRIGEFTWGLCEPEEGRFNFEWMRRVMDIMHRAGIKVILSTPTSAPPIWLGQVHPEILPVDEDGLVKNVGTRRAMCLNSDAVWDHSKQIVTAMAKALGDHPALIAWQIDNGIGGNFCEASFNEDTRRDWHAWLQAKYQTIPRLNDLMGLRHWGQVVSDWSQVPMPKRAPGQHNPALVLDWNRFCSDTIVQYVRMQADLLHELTPNAPVTTNLRPFKHKFDHFDLAEVIDFVSIESTAAIKSRSAEIACEIDMLRSLKKSDIRAPDGDSGFWVIEQKAGNVNWQDVNSVVRPGVLRMFTFQLLSRGANAVLFFRWRQPRFGTEKFHGAVLPHHIRNDNRIFREISQIGEEIKLLGPALQGTRVMPEVAILYSHDNEWTLQQPNQPNKFFNLREHINLIYTALHDKNILTDFARPSEDLSRYKIVFAPSMHLLAAGEVDRLRLYVQNGGILVATCNTGLVDEHHLAPDSGYPSDMVDLFGLEVVEFDMLPPNEENHLTFKGAFPTSHLHPARLWCDIIDPQGCQVLATYAKDFYAGKPAVTMHSYGMGKTVYVGTISHQHLYYDLVGWLRQTAGLHSLLKVPENIEVSMRQKDDTRIFFLLNHQNTPVRVQFFKPMHEFLTGQTFTQFCDVPPHGVVVLDEHPVAAPGRTAPSATPPESQPATPAQVPEARPPEA
jgi:beta-galactosidase